ncbi:hypothetical protein F3Y22_tig00111915pilonHSYRG00019 [Hibiscus syriacus]|uniref:O-fucosyltransferase family protein n=1 Tax=Hibiscus syriacus TaxID=106335 RepID=A0A6A2X8W2_HIBSY|nr:hypothetical protein F3Y22_tig00111915pilonHSYRG00019 [Hibiscus syriacus]
MTPATTTITTPPRLETGRDGTAEATEKAHVVSPEREVRCFDGLLMVFVSFLDSLMVSVFDSINFHRSSTVRNSNGGEVHSEMYSRLLNLASSALAKEATKWKPCADKRYPTSLGKPEESNGYIMVSTNGGLNQQRVALPWHRCSMRLWFFPNFFTAMYGRILGTSPAFEVVDVEAIGSLITDADIPKEAKPNNYVSTVLPLLMKNKVVHFLGFGNRLGFDPLPPDLQRLRCKCNFHALTTARRFRSRCFLQRGLCCKRLIQIPCITLEIRGGYGHTPYVISEAENEKKELETYREVHFPLLIERLKNTKYCPNSLLSLLFCLMSFPCKYLIDPFLPPLMLVGRAVNETRQIASYSRSTRSRLDKYSDRMDSTRVLTSRNELLDIQLEKLMSSSKKLRKAKLTCFDVEKRKGKSVLESDDRLTKPDLILEDILGLPVKDEACFSCGVAEVGKMPIDTRRSRTSSCRSRLGRCPLTPEEAALVLAALGFKRGTYIYLAGSRIYSGSSRMHPFSSLYPNLITKETLLTPIELAPFRNFSSQLAALDFIACATSDVFAMTDSGSQLSSLVSGFRTYYGDGHAPTLRPNKKRLAAIFQRIAP